MKTTSDPRHQRRIRNIQALFAWDCQPHQENLEGIASIIQNLTQIDALISRNAPRWPIEKINKIDLAILRLAFYELLFEPATPPKVVIDEAIEIAKEFGNSHSYSFINAVLGAQINGPKTT